jgi:Skp family chaperone for outer membrane proteins
MNKTTAAMLAAAALLAAAGCARAPAADIGVVDVQRIVAHWPKFINYQNQLNSDVTTIQQARAPDDVKRRQMEDVQRRFAVNQTELTNDVRDAATKVAGERHMRFVFTRQYVGYGGVDITTEVEKVLRVEEKTPAP